MSGFPKQGTIKPVITLVLCWSPDEWDGPRSLHDMMDNMLIKRYGNIIDDYKLHLVSVYDLSDEKLRSLKTDIGLALEFSKHSKEIDRISEYQTDIRFRSRSNEFVATINEMTKSEFKLNKKGGTVDMCQGIKELQEAARNQGRQDGINESIHNSLKALEEYFVSEGTTEVEAKKKAEMILLQKN